MVDTDQEQWEAELRNRLGRALVRFNQEGGTIGHLDLSRGLPKRPQGAQSAGEWLTNILVDELSQPFSPDDDPQV